MSQALPMTSAQRLGAYGVKTTSELTPRQRRRIAKKWRKNEAKNSDSAK